MDAGKKSDNKNKMCDDFLIIVPVPLFFPWHESQNRERCFFTAHFYSDLWVNTQRLDL
jgi:hypothetical protein